MAFTSNRLFDGKMKHSCGTISDSTESSLTIPTGLPSLEVFLVTDQTCPERAIDLSISGGNVAVTNYTASDILNWRAWSGF